MSFSSFHFTLANCANRESMGIFKAIASKNSFWAAISLLGLLLACYANSFHGAWQYDDFVNIVNNTRIHMTEFSWPQIRKVLSAGPDFQIVGRPLAYLSFALNHLWGGQNPLGYHIVNFAIHFLASLVLFFFVRDTLRLPVFNARYTAHADSIAWLATLCWACHPIQVTAVTYVVQRMTAMAGLFYITALYAYLIGRRSEHFRGLAYGLCAISAGCALLTKENAVLLPYAIVLYELLCFRPLNRKTLCRAFFAVLGVTVFLLLLSALYTNPLRLFEPYANRPFTMAERLLTQPRVLFIYLWLLAVPMASRMSILHDVATSTSLTDPWSTGLAILALGVILLLLCLMIPRHRLFAFCGLFFFLNHAVESSFLNLELIYEHRNYVPSMMLFVPLAVGVVRAMALFYYRPVLRIVIAVCVGLFVLVRAQTTYEYNRTFASEFDLWRHVTVVYPNCSLAYNNLGKAYWAAGEFEKSHQNVLKAIELDNFKNQQQKGMGYYNLGLYAANVKGDYQEALVLFEKAREFFGDLPSIWHEVVRVCMHLSFFDAADQVLAEALDRWPDDQILNGLSAINKIKQADYRTAIQVATSAMKADRIERRIGLMVIARSQWLLKEHALAVGNLEKILDQDPKNVAALLAMAEIHVAMDQPEEARTYLKKILDLKGIDYLKNGVAFNIEAENIMPYIPDERVINELIQDMDR